MQKPTGVLHLTDTLVAGGKERIVVNLVNHLPREWYQPFLCTTRFDGPLLKEIVSDVIALHLWRRHVLDVKALKLLVLFIRKHKIQILHAHGPSVFVATIAAFFPPFPSVVWHIHDGGMASSGRPSLAYRFMARRAKGIITVNQALADWITQALHMNSDRVRYIPNFVGTISGIQLKTTLPGEEGWRIVCLANLLPVKDHITLLRAMTQIIQEIPKAHLVLVGSTNDRDCLSSIEREISIAGLTQHVSILGYRKDVLSILRTCDIGVLSSKAEGFPMALLEYGMAGLPTVATQVGQCPEVLDYGRAGMLVAPGSPAQLAQSLMKLLRSHEQRQYLGNQLKLHVKETYNQQRILEKFCQFYRMILGGSENAVSSTESP
ncbi:glycosyltransferase [Candidatus Nitrospira allomarina]|uniref:Glycosyltransferase n=1 Tax=Candidatus Nitrospira allomarina TaxID=3020900 RepID=A0AA96GFX7_9BACT|nr:glycosyltransferase [Candidatus Nitrospira allomarina]WNM58128.1 glycosyltransferase [Candidatus Nitrospira allomarina]